MRTQLALGYIGPAVEAGQMDVYEASANMVAFSDFVVAASKATYGDSVSASAQVAGFVRGSFVTDLVFDLSGLAATVFSAVSPKDLLDTIRQSIDLWRHLRGSPPRKVEHHTQTVNVENNNGQVLTVSIQSLNLVFNPRAAAAAQQFVGKALTRAGVNAVDIRSPDSSIGQVTRDEAGYFVEVAPFETVTDHSIRMVLVIEAPVFKEANKWRFSDGQQSFHADIADIEFLARVDAGERFGKGDLLVADVRISQQQSGMKLTAERTIMKVLEHKQGPRQLTVFD